MYLNDIFIRIKYVHYKYPTMLDVSNSDVTSVYTIKSNVFKCHLYKN